MQPFTLTRPWPPAALGALGARGRGGTLADQALRLLDLPADAEPEAVIAAATAALVPALGDRASCILLDGPRVVYATHTPVHDLRIDIQRYPEIGRAVATQAPVAVEDPQHDRRLRAVRALLPGWLRGVVALPLLDGQRCLGVLLAQSEEPREPSPADLRAGALIGRLAGRMIDCARLRTEARVDELTGLANLRELRRRLPVEVSRCRRHATPLALLMLDVDGLKRINDRWGHAMGSRALSTLAHILEGETRASDLAARYGGDEFVVVLPHATLADALRFAERVLARTRAAHLGGPRLAVSVGAAALVPGLTDEELLRRADAAAYAAKRAGGDRALPWSD